MTALQAVLQFLGFVITLPVPGLSQGSLMLATGLSASALAVGEGLLGTVLFGILALRRRRARRIVAGLPALACLGWTAFAIWTWMGPPVSLPGITTEGYARRTFERIRNGERQTLVFFGVQHVADDIYYGALTVDFRQLDAQDYTFLYEASEQLTPPPRVLANMTNQVATGSMQYGVAWIAFMHNVMSQPFPLFWPGMGWGRIEAVDLRRNDPAAIRLRSEDFGGDAAAWCTAWHTAREDVLLGRIDTSASPRIAVVYGLAHLNRLRGRLVERGWTAVTQASGPVGRQVDLAERRFDGNCLI